MDVQHRVSLWVDGNEANPTGGSSEDPPTIKLDYAILEGIELGDLLEVVPLSVLSSSAGSKRAQEGRWAAKRWSNGPGLLFHVTPLADKAKQPGLQLSIPYTIAKAFELDRLNRSEVLLRKVLAPVPPEYCADHIELFFRDQYLGRAEMLRISTALVNSPVHIGREVGLGSLKVRTRVGRIYNEKKRVYSGYVTPFTNVVFRSESAKYYIFIQISSEMWNFEEDGSLYHEKAVLFLEDLFNRWSKIGTNHIVSLVLFSRLFYTVQEAKLVPPPVLMSDSRRPYKDFYRVIVDLEPTMQWQRLLAAVRQEIAKFQYNALTFADDETGERKMAGRISNAHEGNILETMGIACNSFDEHFIDRDLRRTGVSIILVTAGTCVYDVEQRLLRLTVERFIDHGIGVDFVSLSKVPLHVIPLFRFRAPDFDADDAADPERRADASRNPVYIDADQSAPKTVTYYHVPFFVDCSFFSRHQDRPFRIDRFMPRCRMPQIQSGIGEHDLTGIQIPLLSGELHASAYDEDPRKRRLARLKFDAAVASVGSATQGAAVAKPIVPRRRVTSASSNASQLKAIPGPSQTRPGAPPSPAGPPRSLRRTASSATALSAPKPPKDRAASTSATPALIARLTSLAQPPQPAPTALSNIWPWSRNESTGSAAAVSKVTAAATGSSANRSSSKVSTRHEPTHVSAAETRTAGSSHTRPIDIRSPSRDSTVEAVLESSRREERFNPSNPSIPSQGLLSQARRWSAIFPRAHNDQRSLKWKSLTTPGCLPLTTDFQPTPQELDTLYDTEEYLLPITGSSLLFKTTSTLGSVEFWREAAVAALREAVYQRMSQSFQIVVPAPSNSVDKRDPYSRPVGASLMGLLHEAEKGMGAPVDLSLSDHYHRIRLSASNPSKASLHVQIFVRQRSWASAPYDYRPAIWSGSAPSTWEETTLRFEFPDLDTYDFRTLDSIITGIEKGMPLSDRLNYWRTRVAFLPAPVTRRDFLPHENLDPSSSDDEIRLAGMLKLQTNLQSITWKNPSEGSIQGPILDFTTSDVAQYVRQESDRLIALAAAIQNQRERAGRIVKDNTVEAIAEAMLHPVHGVDIRTRRWQVRSYEDVFTGERMVTFLQHQFELPTREEALQFGRSLQQQGLFRAAAAHSKQLVDGFTYYELGPDFAPAKAPRVSWFGRSDKKEEKRGRTATPDSKRSRSQSRTRRSRPRPRVEMTRVNVIELDGLNKSDRSEKAIMHCDISHSAANAWHIELQWMGITSLLVDTLLQTWSRIVERYGIKMVEQNVRSLSNMEDFSPLQKAIPIRLACPPPPIADFVDRIPSLSSPQNWFEGQLLRSQGFVLDIEADSNFPADVEVVYSYHRFPFVYSQFVHSSGVAVVQVRDRGFLWADNVAARVAARRFGVSQPAPPADALILRRNFTALCKDAERLQAFWDECITRLTRSDEPTPELGTADD